MSDWVGDVCGCTLAVMVKPFGIHITGRAMLFLVYFELIILFSDIAMIKKYHSNSD